MLSVIDFIVILFLPGRRAQQANASVRAAFVHVLGDLLQSISVLVSAIIIFFKVRPLSFCLRTQCDPTV